MRSVVFWDAMLLAKYQGTKYSKLISKISLPFEQKQTLEAKNAMLSDMITIGFASWAKSFGGLRR